MKEHCINSSRSVYKITVQILRNSRRECMSILCFLCCHAYRMHGLRFRTYYIVLWQHLAGHGLADSQDGTGLEVFLIHPLRLADFQDLCVAQVLQATLELVQGIRLESQRSHDLLPHHLHYLQNREAEEGGGIHHTFRVHTVQDIEGASKHKVGRIGEKNNPFKLGGSGRACELQFPSWQD